MSFCAVLAICIGAFLIPRAALAQATSVAGAGNGVFPSGAVWQGIPLSGLRFGTGVSLGASGAAKGNFETTIAGATVAGVTRKILVNGKATSGSSPAGGPATFSGLCSLDMGDGTPPLASVPFSVIVTKSATGSPTLALTVNSQPLPLATVTRGGVGIK
jgi:hypothetical protein